MIAEYYSKARDIRIEFQYDHILGDWHTPDHTEILITSVTRQGVDVADLIPEYELATEVRENLKNII